MADTRRGGWAGGGWSAASAALVREEAEDRRAFEWAVAGAVLLHLILFALRLPQTGAVSPALEPKRTVVVLATPHFRPPDPAREAAPEPRRRRVAMPDPTPDALEPIRSEIDAAPPLDLAIDEVVLGLPAAPPAEEVDPDAPLPFGGEITAPEKLFAPSPAYTEIARQARRTGLVILQATIDSRGEVRRVTLIKGLGLGLDESAVDAVSRWRFAPATLRGRPVSVLYNLTVRFELR